MMQVDICYSECACRNKVFKRSRFRTTDEDEVTATGTDQSGAREAVAAEERAAIDEGKRTVVDTMQESCAACIG